VQGRVGRTAALRNGSQDELPRRPICGTSPSLLSWKLDFRFTEFSEASRAGPIAPGAPEEGCSHRRVLCSRTVM
jgi:hypothetical protein